MIPPDKCHDWTGLLQRSHPTPTLGAFSGKASVKTSTLVHTHVLHPVESAHRMTVTPLTR